MVDIGVFASWGALDRSMWAESRAEAYACSAYRILNAPLAHRCLIHGVAAWNTHTWVPALAAAGISGWTRERPW